MDRNYREKDSGAGIFTTLFKVIVILLATGLMLYLFTPISGSLEGRIVEQHWDSDYQSIIATIEITNHTNKLAQNVKASINVTGENQKRCGSTKADVSHYMLPTKSEQITVTVPLETSTAGSYHIQLSVDANRFWWFYFPGFSWNHD